MGDSSIGAEGGTAILTATAGAPANSLFIDATGRVGYRTGTPQLNLHVKTGNTPALRFEQDASAGQTAQTWDVGGNEAGFFFARDVTAGGTFPFRIRPGAPTSSIDIAASGNVGIGTTTPSQKLHLSGTGNTYVFADGPAANAAGYRIGSAGATSWFMYRPANSTDLRLNAGAGDNFTFTNAGFLGIGTATPTARLHTVGTVRFAGLPSCSAGIQTDASGNLSCITSSQRFKLIAGRLSPERALANVMALEPQVGSYAETLGIPEHWLIAEDAAAVDPALAGLHDGEPYTVKTQNVVADLVAVIQEQQRQLEQQQQRIEALEQRIAAQ